LIFLKTVLNQKKRLFLLHLDFIATEFSQIETNRFFWIISDDPNLGEEPYLITEYPCNNPGTLRLWGDK
jgi:hypothetical protein